MDLIDRKELLKDYTQTFVVGHGMKVAETFRGVVKQAQKVDAIPIPKNATNGDMFLMLFPNVLATKLPHAVFVDFEDNITQLAFDRYWWDSKYKEKVKEHDT